MRRRDFIKAIAGSTVVRPLAAGAQQATVKTLHPGKLTVCTYGGFAPVCYRDAAGHLVGYDVSFLRKFAEQQHLAIELIGVPFDYIWTLPAKKPPVCDVAGAGVMERKNRHVGNGGSWSKPYFEVKRSLLVRARDKAEFDKTFYGKRIIVTRGSTAEIDARERYMRPPPPSLPPNAMVYVEDIVPPRYKSDPQGFIAKVLIRTDKGYTFGEGDISNKYLRDKYGKDVPGGLALADVHPMAGGPETFNFITRNDSTGVREALNDFIDANKGGYAPSS
jgi:hypothetical protein